MIIIIDLNLGNVGSIFNMFEKIGVSSKISNRENDILKAAKLILPGVGAFDSGIEKIKKNNLINSIENKVLDKSTPILGICLGMQMMLESSEEGKKKGLGWIKGKVTKFTDHNLKIPHMGWNQVRKTKNNKLTNNLLSDSRFYFVHSYFANLKDKKNQILQTEYGENFTSAFNLKNIYGVQFHPEKSHKFGMKLLENFSKI